MNIARSLAIYVGLSALLSLSVSCKHPSDGFSLCGLIEGTEEENGKYVVTEWMGLNQEP